MRINCARPWPHFLAHRPDEGPRTKGREVAVVGKLRLAEWTRREGERRSKVQVIADTVTFLGKPKTAGEPDGDVAEPAQRRKTS